MEEGYVVLCAVSGLCTYEVTGKKGGGLDRHLLNGKESSLHTLITDMKFLLHCEPWPSENATYSARMVGGNFYGGL